MSTPLTPPPGGQGPPGPPSTPGGPFQQPPRTLPPLQPPPGPDPAGGAPPRRKRRWLGWTIAGVVAAVVVAGVGIGYYISQQQQKHYDEGHKAYLAADCASAVGPLRDAAEGDWDDDLAAKAQAELQECETLLAAGDMTRGEPGAALLAFSEFLTKYPSSPMVPAALAGGQLVSQGPPDGVATATVCAELDRLEGQGLLSPPDDVLPPLLRTCGRTFETAGNFASALAMLDRFRREYPNHELVGEVDADFVRVTLAEADATGSGELQNPESIGPSGEAGDLVSVEIHNDSSEEMTIVFRGPEVRVETLPACTECDVVRVEATCSEAAPIGRYVLDPGDYDVLVKASSGSNVQPYRGTWTLEPGQGYADCFYISTTPG